MSEHTEAAVELVAKALHDWEWDREGTSPDVAALPPMAIDRERARVAVAVLHKAGWLLDGTPEETQNP